jgi:predicted nucleotide-binding protein (sugar kinase/HSP70/actin superfamily)
VVGEIYLRTHVQSNQDVLRVLERHGAEVVNASIAEWIHYTTYDALRKVKIELAHDLRRLRFGSILSTCARWRVWEWISAIRSGDRGGSTGGCNP